MVNSSHWTTGTVSLDLLIDIEVLRPPELDLHPEHGVARLGEAQHARVPSGHRNLDVRRGEGICISVQHIRL